MPVVSHGDSLCAGPPGAAQGHGRHGRHGARDDHLRDGAHPYGAHRRPTALLRPHRRQEGRVARRRGGDQRVPADQSRPRHRRCGARRADPAGGDAAVGGAARGRRLGLARLRPRALRDGRRGLPRRHGGGSRRRLAHRTPGQRRCRRPSRRAEAARLPGRERRRAAPFQSHLGAAGLVAPERRVDDRATRGAGARSRRPRSGPMAAGRWPISANGGGARRLDRLPRPARSTPR